MNKNHATEILQETLQILEQGSYTMNGTTIKLKLSKEEMEKACVLLPEDVQDICSLRAGRNIHSRSRDFKKASATGRCGFSCENIDSFTAARRQYERFGFSFEKDAKPVLVLNFANPVNPGGGVRWGARAQEEDLCRKSSLLRSLESRSAADYYRYNRGRNTYMGSDAMIFSPQVEILRDEKGNLLSETVIVAVLTCGAPMVTYGKEGMSEEKYQDMLFGRITKMLKCAAYFGYQYLILGAWGCGAFGNDARVISDLFYKAFKEMSFYGLRGNDCFRQIDFAVLDRTAGQYNLNEFCRNFASGSFYREENQRDHEVTIEKIRETDSQFDRIRGSLFGGAAGDSLGYPVEFFSEKQIFSKFGKNGIQDYELDPESGKALISDDTQMTLFTANGLLAAKTRQVMEGIKGAASSDVAMSYQDWLLTQEVTFEESRKRPRGYGKGCISWLLDVPELYCLRAPGNTCLSALCEQKNRRNSDGNFIDNPQNASKGCGGIMRVAPIAFQQDPFVSIKELDRQGAQIAAITHGHSLGYMPAAVLVHIISRLVYPKQKQTLKEIVLEARDTITELFSGDKHLKELTDIISLAVGLSENGESDLDNIHQIGEGWVAEETLGIGIYCSLRYQDDFSAGIIAAVNHKGDSDSTGAVTGNILGALLGYDRIDRKWKHNLELEDVILEMADDLCYGCQMLEDSYQDPDWIRKYRDMRWKD